MIMSSEIISRSFTNQYIEELDAAAKQTPQSLSRLMNDFDLVLNAIPKQASTTNNYL